MRFPEGYNFEDPGVPSLTVSYLFTNDFFYSGHVGFPIIFALEYYRKGLNFMIIPCICVSLFESFTMIVTRGHYFIDLVFGVIFAHYSFKIAVLVYPVLSNALKRRNIMPLYLKLISK